MAKYKDIGGTTVGFKSGAEEYAYPSPEGELFYNSSNGQFQFVGLGTGAWSTGGNLNTGRSQSSHAGTLTAGLTAGGFEQPAYNADVEEYNGTAWTEVNNIPRVQRHMGGCGTQTAAIVNGGAAAPPGGAFVESFEYDGTNWTEGGDMNVAKYNLENVGTQTAALAIAGQTGSPDNDTAVGTVESYNGTSWTEIADLSSSRRAVLCFGTSTAAISASGHTPPSAVTTLVESWNGTAWSEIAEVNTARADAGVSGSQTLGLIATGVGTGDALGVVEDWNGTAWTEVQNVTSARATVACSNAGSSSSMYITGGSLAASNPDYATTNTEEWTFSHSIKTVTTS